MCHIAQVVEHSTLDACALADSSVGMTCISGVNKGIREGVGRCCKTRRHSRLGHARMPLIDLTRYSVHAARKFDAAMSYHSLRR